jgi:hypothetical protein
MSGRHVDLLNIGLMLGSCALAFVLPFELFVFAYAVLGPLHYLTEISWLHSKRYFTERRFDAVWLVLPLVVLLLGQHEVLALDMPSWVPLLNALGLGIALAVAFFRNWWWRGGVVLVALGIGLSTSGLSGAHDLLRVFLPTLIHVWLFTGAFVLLGALRSGSHVGLASLGVFVACTLACFLIRPGVVVETDVQRMDRIASSYEAIVGLNVTLVDWLGLAPLRNYTDAFLSEGGRMVARFIAFAYTYHYLNWFSKTSVIQWHRIPRAWSVANIALWLAAVGLYAWDFQLGLLVLFGLSYLHVYLEFPLNHRTFVGIGRELAVLGRGGGSGPAARQRLQPAATNAGGGLTRSRRYSREHADDGLHPRRAVRGR